MIQGRWQEEGSAAQHDAALRIEGERFILLIEGNQTINATLDTLQISNRLGNVERKITLEDGSVFASGDNDVIDDLVKGQKFGDQSRFSVFLHRIETNMAWVLTALAITLVCLFSFFKWGVPMISTKVAQALPHKANTIIAAHTLDFLDDYFFAESALSENRRQKIVAHFNTALLPLEATTSEVQYALHFRQWGEGEDGIPNAFALPSGDIILTDRFVELSEHQDEIDAVILHEIGHVVHRHTLETVVESTLIATIVMVATGDSNGLADMGIGLGSLLVSNNYSRGHESEADLYAFKKMLIAGIDPNAFSKIMTRITEDMNGHNNQANEEEKEDSTSVAKLPKRKQARDDGFLDYLSSHPSTAQRVEQAEQFSRCFKQGLLECNAGQL